MTDAVAFEPHSDDVALFCAFSAMQHQAHVVTVLEGHVQAARGLPITQQVRVSETGAAMRELGLEWSQWPFRDDRPDWDAVAAAMRALDERVRPVVVLAPQVELGGHSDHNAVGDLAQEVFGVRVVYYTTYARGYPRTVTEFPVVGSPDQIGRKLRGLACYRSQIAEPSCQPWFLEGMTEYLA